MKYEELGKGVVKRTERRVLGLFIDGTGLDRATRRISRKVDMSALVRGVTSGLTASIARYYTLIPYGDDSRQRAFLDAVTRAGLTVIVKRLPPKGVSRQVSVDVEMAADIIAFSLGHSLFSDLSQYRSVQIADGSRDGGAEAEFSAVSRLPGLFPVRSAQFKLRQRQGVEEAGRSKTEIRPPPGQGDAGRAAAVETQNTAPDKAMSASSPILPHNRIVTVVCPGRDLVYPISLARELGVDTVTADFGQFNTGDILKSAAKWIDLSDSETIWRE